MGRLSIAMPPADSAAANDEPLPSLEDQRPRGNDLRRAMALVTTAWLFGSVWQNTTSGAPLTLFAANLGASKFHFGLITAAPFLASLLSLPASFVIECTGRRRGVFLWGLYLMRLMWVPLALVPVLLVQRWGGSPAATRSAMGVFLLLFFVMNCGNAVGNPAWTGWMADIVPTRIHGRYFSKRRQIGNMAGLPAALLAGLLLDLPRVSASGTVTLWACVAIFLVAAAFGTFDIACFHFVPEPVRPPCRGRDVLRALARPLRDRQYLIFGGFVGVLTFALGFTNQFSTLFLVERANMSNTAVQAVTVAAPLIAQLLVLSMWGSAADRVGKRPLMAIASFGLVPVAVGWCFVGVGGGGLMTSGLAFALSAAGAALWAGVEVANLNVVLDRSRRQIGGGGSAYVAVNTVITNVAGCIGGLVAGAMAQGLRDWSWHLTATKTLSFYDVLFTASAALRLLGAVVFLPLLVEPTAKSAAHATKFLAARLTPRAFRRAA